jgi:hypothetical protein
MGRDSELNKGVVVAIVAIVAVVVCVAGYRLFFAPSAAVSDQTRQMYMERMKNAGPPASNGLNSGRMSPSSGGR